MVTNHLLTGMILQEPIKQQLHILKTKAYDVRMDSNAQVHVDP